MTELQQKDFEELHEQLQQEESCCENCGDWRDYGAAACEGCRTHGNIRDIETLIADLEGNEKA